MNTFEDRLKRLETVSASIKDSEISLEQALSLFEEGISLAKGLETELDKIEGKIQILVNDPGTDSLASGDDNTSNEESKLKKKSKSSSKVAEKSDTGLKPELDLFAVD